MSLSAWYRHGIQVESTVPINTLRELTEEKWQKFCELRLPRVIEQISAKRNHYLEVMNRIETRTKNKELESQIITPQEIIGQNKS